MSDLPLLPLSFDDGDVILRAGDTNFQVHIWLLRLASPFFQSMFSLPQPNLGKSEIPIILIEEEATSLDFILRCIYPIETRLSTLKSYSKSQTSSMSSAPSSYCESRSLRFWLKRIIPFDLGPLRFVMGVEEARRAAARHFCSKTWSHPPKELAYVNALQYFQLLAEHGMY
jgi:BTB/POZ domain